MTTAAVSVGESNFRLVVSEEAFTSWLATALPGESLVYHHGHLAADRDRLTKALPEPLRLELIRIAERAWTWAEKGLVVLVQRRLGAGRIAYVAIKAGTVSPCDDDSCGRRS